MTTQNDTLLISRKSVNNLIEWFTFMSGYALAHKDDYLVTSLDKVKRELQEEFK